MSKKGILLANIGTPDKPEAKEVREYLKHFLGDKRVIDKPRWQWLPILHGIILNTRPKKSAALYKSIWEEEGSPLLIHTKSQTNQLQEKLPDVSVKFGMAYSHPTISESLHEFEKEGITDVTVIPLYPQYSTTTTASIHDAVFKHYLKQENIPNLHLVREFTSHPLYIELLRRQIMEGIKKYNPELLVFSYHGIPVSYVEKGDPYKEQCAETTTAVFDGFSIDIPYQVTYQSKFGPDEWLTPALDNTLKELPKKGVKKVLIITPGFVSDCIETLEEIEDENRTYFMDNGGTEFNYIHPFNGDPEFIDLLLAIFDSNN
ncbi:ferrochelatase [Vagococcus carniphilus]|uniref:Coproporphyrin III ferrochelatase n=1 Tax=Vagococcus carniphilus TaxID=218144 RepID=A0A430AWI2_9ENTE|nr:ferrochelatase [Vagococcus carniphilus]RSU12422.1 ferrochelatase [Vagococcus carniphilus]